MHSIKAKCVRRFPAADRTEPGKTTVEATLVIESDGIVGDITIKTSDPLLQAYLQVGKHYDVALQLEQPEVESPQHIDATREATV